LVLRSKAACGFTQCAMAHYSSIFIMETRKEELLKLIIENYVATAEPVGSKFLVDSAELDVSGATVRNEMRELEEVGYLVQPHTSAGRIPSEAGYRYYVEHLMRPESLKGADARELSRVVAGERDSTHKRKAVARFTAEYVGNAVIIAWQRHSLYYTGLAYLFVQPEFRDMAHTVRISSLFDECEDRIDDLFSASEGNEPTVLIGKDNPLGSLCGTVTMRLRGESLMAIVGPWRMPYGRVVGLLQAIRSIL